MVDASPRDTVAGRLTGEVALVTGAAHGIGRATAARLAAEGAQVALVDVLSDDVGHAAAEIPGAIAVTADITSTADVDRMAADVKGRLGPVTILVNNAGGAVVPAVPAWELDPQDWEHVVRLNLTSQWLVARSVAPAMIAARRGRIVNIGSGSMRGRPGFAAYSSSKGGVATLTRTLAAELGPHDVTVNAIAPGFIRFTRPKSVMAADHVVVLEREMVAKQALPRVGEPADIAAAVAFLASSDAAFVTGQVIAIDGGRTLDS